jgi:hypothetical protein
VKVIVGWLVVIWLLIGAFAGYQRGYYTGDRDVDCKGFSTIAVTIVAGPLNYFGVNPKINCPKAPRPSR